MAAIADDIAYNNHDVDDGVAAGLFGLRDLLDVPVIGPVIDGVLRDWPRLDERMVRLEAVRRMIGVMIDDVLAETGRRLAQDRIDSTEAVRTARRPMVQFSSGMLEDLGRLRAFLMERMYRHYKVNRMRSQAKRTLTQMFQLLVAEPQVLPTEWAARTAGRDEPGRARVVCDYIAGMTDRFAIDEHRRLFRLDLGPEM